MREIMIENKTSDKIGEIDRKCSADGGDKIVDQEQSMQDVPTSAMFTFMKRKSKRSLMTTGLATDSQPDRSSGQESESRDSLEREEDALKDEQKDPALPSPLLRPVRGSSCESKNGIVQNLQSASSEVGPLTAQQQQQQQSSRLRATAESPLYSQSTRPSTGTNPTGYSNHMNGVLSAFEADNSCDSSTRHQLPGKGELSSQNNVDQYHRSPRIIEDSTHSATPTTTRHSTTLPSRPTTRNNTTQSVSNFVEEDFAAAADSAIINSAEPDAGLASLSPKENRRTSEENQTFPAFKGRFEKDITQSPDRPSTDIHPVRPPPHGEGGENRQTTHVTSLSPHLADDLDWGLNTPQANDASSINAFKSRFLSDDVLAHSQPLNDASLALTPQEVLDGHDTFARMMLQYRDGRRISVGDGGALYEDQRQSDPSDDKIIGKSEYCDPNVEWIEVSIRDSSLDYELDQHDVEQVRTFSVYMNRDFFVLKVFATFADVLKVIICPTHLRTAYIQIAGGQAKDVARLLDGHKLEDDQGFLCVEPVPFNRLPPGITADRTHPKQPNEIEDRDTRDESHAEERIAAITLPQPSKVLDLFEDCECSEELMAKLESIVFDNSLLEGPSSEALSPQDRSLMHIRDYFKNQAVDGLSPQDATSLTGEFFSPMESRGTNLDIFEKSWPLSEFKDEIHSFQDDCVPLMTGQSHLNDGYTPKAASPSSTQHLTATEPFSKHQQQQNQQTRQELTFPRIWNEGLSQSHPSRGSNAAPRLPSLGADRTISNTMRVPSDRSHNISHDLSPNFYDSTSGSVGMRSGTFWQQSPDARLHHHLNRNSPPEPAASRPPHKSPTRQGGMNYRNPCFATPLCDSRRNVPFNSPGTNDENHWSAFLSCDNPVDSNSIHSYNMLEVNGSELPIDSSQGRVRKWTARYEIQIPTDNSFQVTRKIIGTRGANMKLVNQLTSAKLRLRGRGSGYLEGSSRLEADDPLHLCISSCDHFKYKAARSMVDRLLRQIYDEYDSYLSELNVSPARLALKVREVFCKSNPPVIPAIEVSLYPVPNRDGNNGATNDEETLLGLSNTGED